MIDLSKLKHKWTSDWDYSRRYVRGEMTRFQNGVYVCIKDIPLEYVSANSGYSVNTSNYMGHSSTGIYIKTKDPLDTNFWVRFTPDAKFVGNWKRNWLYHVGDVVNFASDLYLVIKDSGSIRNLYPEINTDYFVKIFHNADRDARRLWPVAQIHDQPLGWKYNMGETFYGCQSYQPGASFIDAEGNANFGGYNALGYGAMGSGMGGKRKNRMMPTSFTFVDWYRSYDNWVGQVINGSGSGTTITVTTTTGLAAGQYVQVTAGTGSFATGTTVLSVTNGTQFVVSAAPLVTLANAQISYSGTNRLTTPDGKAPRVIQVSAGGAGGTTLFLLNNGEVYSTGYNGHGQLGTTITTSRYYTSRVWANDTTDWLGNTIPHDFNNTRVVKVANSGATSADTANSMFAIDEFGGVWAWGYMSTGCLGLGNQLINNSATSGNLYTDGAPTYRPRRLPQSFFNNKRIVDIYAFGGSRARVFCIDEDGDLWAFGKDNDGELGTGQMAGADGTSYNPTPWRVPVDWSRYGGIKKIMHCGDSNGVGQRVAILDGQNKLWVAGRWASGYSGQSLASQADISGNNFEVLTYGRTPRFVRLEKGWFRDHDIENFWCFGALTGWVIYLREKGTGLLYSLGNNNYGVLGQNGSYAYGSGGDDNTAYSSEPGLVEGPYNVTKMTSTQTVGAAAYMTIVAICEDGSGWGIGYNGYGSLGFNFSGTGYYNVNRGTYWTSPFAFQKILQSDAPNNGFTDVHGWGNGQRDACTFITEAGQLQVSGADGDSDTSQEMWQGHWYAVNRWNVIVPANDAGNKHRYHVHSYPMG